MEENKEQTLETHLIAADQILPPNLFVLPINSPLVFPTLLAPLFVTHPHYISLIEESINRNRIIGVILSQTSEISEKTTSDNLYSVGVAVKILKRLKMPDGSSHLLVHGLKRFKAQNYLSSDPYLVTEAKYLEDILERDDELDALIRLAIAHVKKLSEVNPFFTDEMKLALLNAPHSGAMADLIAFALTLPKKEAQEYLETLNVKQRFIKILTHLKKEQDLADLQKKINEEVNNKLNKMQREFFLREQLKSIKKELASSSADPEAATKGFRERIQALKLPEEILKYVTEEISKFETLSEHSPEYNVCRNYLELICGLPWNHHTEDNLDLNRAKKILDKGHYGLNKVKERILEFLAVRKLKKESKGSVICLVGPPGVGKTSIGKSIAQTLGRAFFRFSVGGMRDEAEIKGHRRTYIGSMPGKIIQGLKRAGSMNPILMLDEIDKMLNSYQGDPASALLEVLDPEQNSQFLDHYLDIPFDLSKVLFITTANTIASIPGPLLDRMEVIEIPGYTLEEKLDITKKYILPRELKETGLSKKALRLSDKTLNKIIQDYAREPGLRSLQKMLNQICRKAAAKIVMHEKTSLIQILPQQLRDWLGPQRFYNEMNERIISAGISIGLAWTNTGGDILFIEAITNPGTGNLKLTGQMGEVMTESASIAFSYVKKYLIEKQQFKADLFKKTDVHLHIPAGAIPKDGPSAGITMACSLFSLFTGKIIQPNLAMSGELSLTGKVLPVGGIKEKILAAHRAQIKAVILPALNKKDLQDIPAFVLDQVKIDFVKKLDEVLKIAFKQ